MRRYIVTICLLLTSSTVALGSGFSIYEASVRANGMLGAFSAYADHVSTIYYNPAGLADLDGFRFSGGATIIAPRSSFRNLTPRAPRGAEFDMVEESFLVPNAFASYQIKDGLTFGVGVYAPFGLGTEWDEDWVGRGGSIKAEIATLFANPAIGYKLPNFGIGDVRIGAGLLISVFGDVQLKRAVTSFTPEGTFNLDGDMKEAAFGYNLGLLYSPIDMLTFGFTYRSNVEMEFEGDATFSNLPVGFPSTAGGGATIDMPESFVVAANIKPTDRLTLELDYVWWGWTSFDELRIKFDQTIPALASDELVNERNFQNSYQIRIGGEYTGLFVDNLTARAGFAYDENPIQDRFVDPTLPDSDRLLFSGGLTYTVNSMVDIDAAYIFIHSIERTVRNTESGVNGVYNTYANLPSLGVTLKF